MKTLKKTLSLVLVLAMALSLGIGAGAAGKVNLNDFSDSDSIKYKEEVDVLSGIGILAGFPSGDFQPTGGVTRAESAKIVTYMLIGDVAADNLPKSVSYFEDVPAGHWAAGYVAFCYDKGIIDGYGDGRFGPNDPVTGLQFAKMMLCAAGYGQRDEYVGASWALNVAKDAIPLEIFYKNLNGATEKPATREEAALYAFNTLTGVNKVSYSELLGTYTMSMTMGGPLVEETLGESLYKLFPMYGDIGYGVADYETKDVYRIGRVSLSDGADAYKDQGRAAYVWYQITDDNKFKAVSDYYFNDERLGNAVTSGTSVGDLTDKSKGAYVADLDPDYDVYVNGRSVATITSSGGTTLDNSTNERLVYDYTTKALYYDNGQDDSNVMLKVDGRGVKVELFDSLLSDGSTNGRIDKIMYTVYETAVVATYSASGDGKITFTNKSANTDGYVNLNRASGDWTSKNVVGFGDVAKDDVVIGIKYEGTLYLAIPDTDSGNTDEVTIQTGKATIYRVNGNDRTFAVQQASGNASVPPGRNDKLTIYLDEYGYIVATGDIEVNVANLYYVQEKGTAATMAGVDVRMFSSTGSSRIVTASKIGGTDIGLGYFPAGTPNPVGLIWSLPDSLSTELGNVKYMYPLQPGTIAKGSSILGDIDGTHNGDVDPTIFADSNTIFVDVTNKTAFTGFANKPGDITVTKGAVVLKSGTSYVAAIVFFEGTTATTTKSTFLVYDVGSGFATNMTLNGKEVWRLNGTFKDGVAVDDLYVTPGVWALINDVGIYTIDAVNGDGVVSGLVMVPPALTDAEFVPLTGSAVIHVALGTVVAGGTSWTVNSDTKFVTVEPGKLPTPAASEAASGDVQLGSTVVVTAKGTGGADATTAKVIYIIK